MSSLSGVGPGSASIGDQLAFCATLSKEPMADSLIGRTIGQYKVEAVLGRGQHSTVYKAWQPSLERHVALKVLRHYDQQTLVKFQNEACLTAQLVQQGVPNIRRVYEVGQTNDGYLFVALEYVEDSLQNLLRRVQDRSYRLKPQAAAELLQPIGQVLDAIHSLGWVHLDIKPQNILIKQGGRALLADFGIAQRRGAQTHACTPVYASPEQASGDRPVGPWSDIYSLGVVLYEMVAGHPPVRGDQDIVLLTQHLEVTPPSPRKVNPGLSASQEQSIYKALAKSPQDRFETASDLIEAMMVSEPILSSVIKTPGSILGSTSRRMPRWVVISLIVVLVLAIMALVAWVLWPRLPYGVPSPTQGPTMTIAPTAAPTVSKMATTAPATRTPAPTARPTSTLAPTLTRTPRPSPTPTSESTPTLAATASPEP